MKKPWVLALVAGLIVLLLALPLWRMASGGGETIASTAAASGLPWQVTPLQAADAGRAEVFGLVPGRDTLADAEAVLPDRLQVALVARLGEVGVLEALVEPYVAGFVAGRLVLAQPSGSQALLYPGLGLVASVANSQRGVLQYVALIDFAARLRAPLVAAAAPAPAAASAKPATPAPPVKP